jgi:NAD(P)-dependent dehydrogenase (short-subunit alcohol dehydrogenase family)
MATTRFDFTGRRVLVTGGSSGIGLAVAGAFADAGAEVTVTGRREAADAYGADLSRFAYRQAEMTDGASLEALADGIGALDVLVNNAGSNLAAEDEWKPATFAKALELHLVSAFTLATRLKPLHLVSAFTLATRLKPLLAGSGLVGGGSVVNTVSMSAFRSVPFVPGYGAAKAGLVQMTLNLGAAWARDAVRVNAVAPGLIETGMTAVMKAKGMDAIEKAELERVPMARWGRPEEVAPAYLFLASEEARFITGATLCVDGGFLAR